MPVIVFASPKGGSGKTTSATLFAAEVAGRGGGVTLIDADPNRNISEWATRPGCPAGVKVVAEVGEETILDAIEAAARATPFVVIDLEGTASLMVSYAISQADLVVIPVQGSHLDARQAARAIRLIENQGRAARRTIPYVVVLTRTSPALTPRTLKHVRGELEAAGVPVLDVQLIDREAFRAIFSYGGTLEGLRTHGLDPTAAKANAHAFAAALIERLRQTREAA